MRVSAISVDYRKTLRVFQPRKTRVQLRRRASVSRGFEDKDVMHSRARILCWENFFLFYSVRYRSMILRIVQYNSICQFVLMGF